MVDSASNQETVHRAPSSPVWLAVYRDYNHEEGFCARASQGGFFVRRFGGDRHSVDTRMCDSEEVYCETVKSTAEVMWGLLNMLIRPRGVEVVYVPVLDKQRNVSSSERVWRIGSLAEDSNRDRVLQCLSPLLETLAGVKM